MNRLPQSLECEEAVLAGVLLAPDRVLDIAAARLSVEDFWSDRNRLLWKTMLLLHDRGIEPDLRTMQAALEERGKWGGSDSESGGMAYLASLDMSLPDLGQIETYIRIVKDRSRARQLIRLCHEMSLKLYQEITVDDGIDRLTKGLQSIAETGYGREPTSVTKAADDMLTILEQREGGGLIGMSWGFRSLDLLTQGMMPGNLIIIAARPSMGKSALAANIAASAAFRRGKKVLFLSIEMSTIEITERLVASKADLPLEQVRAARLSLVQWQSLLEAVRRLGNLWIDDTAMSFTEIEVMTRGFKRQHGLDLIIIDYLQLLKGGGKGAENRNQELSEITFGLKILAKSLDIPIILLSQLSRAPERRPNNRPQLSDLRDTGAAEQDGDLILFVFRPEYYDKTDPDLKGKAELIIAKQRNGPTGVLDFVFDGQTVTFKEGPK